MSMMSHIEENTGRTLALDELITRFAEQYGVSETDVEQYVNELVGDYQLQWEIVAFADVEHGDWKDALDHGAREWDL